MKAKPAVIVVTPVKNEAWILPRFLSVTSHFADYILVADQSSSDESPQICRQFPKVTLFKNEGNIYDEAERQRLLIAKAREMVNGSRIILALDADEIMSADSLETPGWQAILNATPGTILRFEKPDLFLSTAKCIRQEQCWPLGYVDDGARFAPKHIHSIRVPTPDGAPYFDVTDVKILHYSMTRPTTVDAKRRFYCIQENILKATPLRLRYRNYSNLMHDWIAERRPKAVYCPAAWFKDWTVRGIDMHTCPQEEFSWYDYEILRLFLRHGTKRFWMEDVWSFDWEKCLASLRESDFGGFDLRAVKRPPRIVNAIRTALIRLLKTIRP